MLSKEQYEHLVQLCETFIHSDGTVISLVNALEKAIPDKTSTLYKAWNDHINLLSETVSGDLVGCPYPEPPPFTSANIPENTTTHAASQLRDHVGAAKAARLAERAEIKLRLDGGNGIGPARQAKSKEEKKRGGRAPDTLIDAVLLLNADNVPGVANGTMYCIGCDHSWPPPRNPMRIRKHIAECNKMLIDFPTLREPIVADLAKRSHSKKLETLDEKATAKNLKPEVSNAALPLAVATAPPPGIRTYMSPSKISENAKMHLEWLLFRMFICCALPWSLLDSRFFKDFVHGINPAVEVPDRSSFFPKHLAQEVAAWSAKFAAFIAQKSNLTLSFDGWSSRAKDEIYTFHTTTALRRSFFTDGRVFKGESVTGVALLNVVVNIFKAYDAKRYSAVAGDGGPNVRAAKIKVVAAYPWILNVYDPCHNLNLYMKDIGKLFKDLLTIVSAIANYFGKSNYGTHHLDVQRQRDGVKIGIKSHSDTRFSSSYAQVVSVKECMGSIKKCLQSGVLKFDTAATKKLIPYIEDGSTHYSFMSTMTDFISILESGANAIVTLEGQNTTCADVFYAWVCIAYAVEKVLSKPSPALTARRAQITGTYNARFEQMMSESSSKMFLLAYYLHPVYRAHGGLRIVMPALPEGKKLEPSRYPVLFKTLLASLLTIFRGEQCRLGDSGQEVVPALVNEFTAYAYNRDPFASHLATWTRDSKPLDWWTSLSEYSNARLLSKIAIKLFSICPSEICDERTASRLGWLNAARRASITPENLIASAKLYDYYVNGFEEGNFTHKARIHLSNSSNTTEGSTQGIVVHSAPNLMDLLNDENVEPQADLAGLEELWFNNPDPYDLAETDRVDEALQPDDSIISRASAVFDMADYIDLKDEKLKALIENTDHNGPGKLVEINQATSTAQIVGTPGQWDINDYL